MINIRELRKGSKVYIGNTDTIYTVGIINAKDDTVTLLNKKGAFGGGVIFIKIVDISPIPITEEILLEHGFKKWRGGQYQARMLRGVYNSINITIQFYEKEVFIIELWIGDEDKNTKRAILDLKYFHQLQNIVFDLTGKEI